MCENGKGMVYNNRVLIGYWYDSIKLEEYKTLRFLGSMESGEMMLAKYRKMMDTINAPTVLTQSASNIEFGATISLLAPYAKGTGSDGREHVGVLLGGRVTVNELNYNQDLQNGSHLIGLPTLQPRSRSAFVITSADYCNRDGKVLNYNQEFLLALSSSLKHGRKPLYVRYDPDPVPGLCGSLQLYLSENPVSNTRWRILPVQENSITRFEQEGKPVQVNKDIIVNHCSTNINLAIHPTKTLIGFYRPFNIPHMKTYLDIYKRELSNNIWQIYTPIAR